MHERIIVDDTLPTPWGTQMWVQTENNESVRSRGTLPGLEHFGGG
jgi:hypothetical protein